MSPPLPASITTLDVNLNSTVISPSLARLVGQPCNVGIDEAGRGPVLGPMVYGVAISPVELHQQLVGMGVADSKALTETRREHIFGQMNGEEGGRIAAYAVRVLSPNELSRQQQRRCKQSLNEISHEAAFDLVQIVIDAGITIDTVFVDTVGLPEKYQEKMQRRFPSLSIIVAKKADSLYPVVSAASIAAKVTRDYIMSNWCLPEQLHGHRVEGAEEKKWGSGYPGDPLTKSFLVKSLDPFFGFSTMVRFDWQTAKTILTNDTKAVQVRWEDEEESSPRAVKSKSMNSYFGKRKLDADQSASSKKRPMSVSRHNFFVDRHMTNVTCF